MSVNVTVKFDVDDFKKRFPAIEKEIDKGTTKALNDAAFDLRQAWITDVVTNTEEPVAFSKKVFVAKANENNLESKTFFPTRQSEYLSKLLDGGRRKPGDIGTLNKTILIPVNAKLNKYGNFPEGPKRWIASLEEKIKGAFVLGLRGSSSDGASRSGVFQRTKKKLKLLAKFDNDVDYKPQLELDKSVETISIDFERNLVKRIEEQLR